MYSEVGPGSYNMNKYEITRLLEYKGLPLPRETRFNFKGKKRSVFLDVVPIVVFSQAQECTCRIDSNLLTHRRYLITIDLSETKRAQFIIVNIKKVRGG